MFAQEIAERFHLPLDRAEIRIHHVRLRICRSEEIAESAAHLAERYMHIEKERVPVLALPQRLQAQRRVEVSIRHLVRIGIGIPLKGMLLQAFGEGHERGTMVWA